MSSEVILTVLVSFYAYNKQKSQLNKAGLEGMPVCC